MPRLNGGNDTNDAFIEPRHATVKGQPEAREILRFDFLEEEDRRAYIRDVEAQVYQRSEISTSRDEGYDDGWEDGRAEGLAEGIEKGIEEGIEKGMAKGIKK